MEQRVFDTEQRVAHEAAVLIAEKARQAIAARGAFHFAVSGGHTPWLMLRDLSAELVPWDRVHLYQVDERIAPAGSDDRNWTHLQASFTAPANLHPMPVESADLASAANEYAKILPKNGLDLVHLGLGPDGHTASLVPNDPVLDVVDADVALTGEYQHRRRMTMTYPLLNSARFILWLVTGVSKVAMTPRLLAADPTIPAGRVDQRNAILLADQSALRPSR